MKNTDLILVCPDEEMEEGVLQYKEEHFAFGDTQIHGIVKQHYAFRPEFYEKGPSETAFPAKKD